MPCTDKQRKLYFYLVNKPRKTKKDIAKIKGLGKRCEISKPKVRRHKVCRCKRK